MFKQKIFLLFILLSITITLFNVYPAQAQNKDKIFKARVIEILEEKEITLPDGSKTKQQKIRLEGEEGEFKGKIVVFNGIGDFEVINNKVYKKGDRVLVAENYTENDEVHYYIIDYVRTKKLFWLLLIFLFSLFLISNFKGLRSAVSLIISFFVITKYIIPKIMIGNSPLFVTFIGSFIILLIIIYFTEGINYRSHTAVISILISLLITIILSWFFVKAAKLTGISSEETAYLINLGVGTKINFQGLLLAGIIIGTLGVLDDVVISQVAAVEQIIKANPSQNFKEIFKKAYEIGVSHISSMTNTLFLAYAGVSLPLLILFLSGQSAFSSWLQIINNEIIATEIIRTLAGSTGLILSIPISTLLAVWILKKHYIDK